MRVQVRFPGAPPRSSRRMWFAAAATLVVLVVAIVAGISSPVTGGAPVLFGERLSSALTNFLSKAGSVWWAYAFSLGIVAAFNPCGFALLPAYLGLYLNDEQGLPSRAARIRRSLVVSATVATAFTVPFGVMGALCSGGARLISPMLPWAGLAVGVLLILFGGALVAGVPIGSTLPHVAASRLGRPANDSGIQGFTAFGLAYGLASLGCALPVFLALLGTAVAAGGPLAAVEAFVLYGAGMAATLGVVTLVAATVSVGFLARVRGATRYVSALGAALLLLSGAYVVYYWLTAGRLLV